MQKKKKKPIELLSALIFNLKDINNYPSPFCLKAKTYSLNSTKEYNLNTPSPKILY